MAIQEEVVPQDPSRRMGTQQLQQSQGMHVAKGLMWQSQLQVLMKHEDWKEDQT